MKYLDTRLIGLFLCTFQFSLSQVDSTASTSSINKLLLALICYDLFFAFNILIDYFY
jgi:hypothetical protein